MPRHQQKCNLNAAELGTDVLFVSSKNPGTPRQQWSFFLTGFLISQRANVILEV